jgi:hypothetical protein
MEVQLWIGGTYVATTNTDETGFYEFNNLVPGTYEVRFICETNSLTDVAASEPARSDPQRNRAVAVEKDLAHAIYSITSGHGIGANVGEPVNAGFKGDGPMSSDIDLRAFVAEDGVYVEFLAYDVEQDGSMILYVLGPNNEVIAQYEVDVNQSDRQLVRFKILENLKAGGAYNFALRDEVGQYWSANGVLVGTLSTKAVKMTRQGISLTINTLPGREYTVRWTERLGLPWQNVTNFTAVGEQTTLVVKPPVANATSGFFEVTGK